jgi:hypothetical protein
MYRTAGFSSQRLFVFKDVLLFFCAGFVARVLLYPEKYLQDLSTGYRSFQSARMMNLNMGPGFFIEYIFYLIICITFICKVNIVIFYF